MTLSRTLTPFPLPLPGDGERAPAYGAGDDFVSPVEVKRVLLGATGHLPVAGLSAEDDSFAGRGDVRLIRSSPFTNVAGKRPVKPAPVRQMAIHPVFQTIIAPRRATPPKVMADVENDFGSTAARTGDSWWMMAVAVAVGAVTLSSTVVDVTSREAAHRAAMAEREQMNAQHARPAAAPRPAPPAENPAIERPSRTQPMATAQAGPALR